MITSCENESLLIETDLLQEGGGQAGADGQRLDSSWEDEKKGRRRRKKQQLGRKCEQKEFRGGEEDGGGQASVTS